MLEDRGGARVGSASTTQHGVSTTDGGLGGGDGGYTHHGAGKTADNTDGDLNNEDVSATMIG